jgi:hypothetical protein
MLPWSIHFNMYYLQLDEHNIQSSRFASRFNINWPIDTEFQIEMVTTKGINYLQLKCVAFWKSISVHDIRKESSLTLNTVPIHLLLYRFGTGHETSLYILSLWNGHRCFGLGLEVVF